MNANVASYWSKNGSGPVHNWGNFINRGCGPMNRGGRGRGKSNSRRIYYHLCGKFGHFVDKCYHRFDRNFQWFSNKNFGRTGSLSQSDPRAYITVPSDSNEVFMSEIGYVQGVHYGNFPQA